MPVWFCPECQDGPFHSEIQTQCTTCNRRKCFNLASPRLLQIIDVELAQDPSTGAVDINSTQHANAGHSPYHQHGPAEYRWVCCQCSNDNSWTLNPVCMGDNCDHKKGCEDCRIYQN
ncbi:hypothetical protein GQ44DRAFT_707099 [Phaeosphaeriaceae sp. PMI808]|nr:hypothetical protein GQ44DRAFT_707099 [Phaeosphaeriaceae sp. PMI808]